MRRQAPGADPPRGELENTGTGACHAHYDVDLGFATSHWPPGNEQAAFTDGKGMFAVSKALFVESDLPGESSLEIRKPADWKFETPWAVDVRGDLSFSAR